MDVEVRKQDGTVISEKRDVTIVDTANPFGNLAEIDIEDDSGNLYDQFEFGTRVEIFVRDLLTDFEVENENDILIEETETLTIKGGDNRTIQETDILTIEETETESGRVISNEGVIANQGTFTSVREVRKQRVWENQGVVTNYDTAQSIADDPRPNFSQRFAGYVVERNDQNEQSGRDNLQLTVYSFDQLLRADSVSNDQTGKTITDALEDIIKTDTAVSWDANNVNVVDEQELTESLQGEKVEDALLKLSTKSVDEQFGVNDSIEFFFREQEPVAAPNNITDGDWIDYQLPERGEENMNESRTYFNSDSGEDSDRVAVVDDGVNQLELQESLGTDDPVVISDDRNRNDLSNAEDAAEDSEQNINDKEVAKVYEFVAEAEDFLTAKPGQVFDVTIQAAGIDGEFRIAELEYQDVGSTVRITAIRNKGNTDDVLRRVTERLRRQELSTADFDGPVDRINIAEVGVEIADTLSVDGTAWDNTRITNTLRNQIRDGWGGQGNVNVSEIAVGTDNSDLARTNESLGNQVATASVTETLDGSFAVDYDASFSQTDIQEIGLLDGSGNLLYRAVNDTAASPGTVDITLTVNNNPDIPKAVVTDLGRESIRDIIADNNPALPVNYGFGSDQTEPSTSDTSLGTSVFVADLENSLIQSALNDSEFTNLLDISDSDPLEVNNGVNLLQSNYVFVDGDSTERKTERRGQVDNAEQEIVHRFQFGPFDGNLENNFVYKNPSENQILQGTVFTSDTADNVNSLPVVDEFGEDLQGCIEDPNSTSLFPPVVTETTEVALQKSDGESVVIDGNGVVKALNSNGSGLVDVFVENGSVKAYQSPNQNNILNVETANGDDVTLKTIEEPDFMEFTVSTDYDISNPEIAIRGLNDDLDTFPDFTVSIGGQENRISPFVGDFDWFAEPFSQLNSGNYKVRVEYDGNYHDDEIWLDVLSVYDAGYSYNFDNTTNADDYLSGPELYPDVAEITFSTATTRRELNEALAELTINDTSNNQFVELSNDGGSTFKRGDNTDSFSTTFDSFSNEVIGRAGLSRYGSQTTATPLEGINGQQIDTWDLFANPLAVLPDGIGTALTIGLIPRNKIVGSTIRELGQLDNNEKTLTRSIRAALTVESEMRVFGRERLLITQA